MRKRTNMNVDMGLLARARRVLHTSNTTETVHAALEDVVRRSRLESLAARDLPDLTPEALDEMRAPRSTNSEHPGAVAH